MTATGSTPVGPTTGPTRGGTNSPPAVFVDAVSKRFGGVTAVRDVTLSVPTGQRRAVLGPNGAGKSTLFNLIAGGAPVTEGRIELFGQDVTGQDSRRRTRSGLSRTFQTSRLLGGLSVRDNLYLAALGVGRGHLRIWPSREDRRLRDVAVATAERVGMTDRLNAPAGDLSHGEQRQLEIGLALAAEPRLLLLDEPAAGLSRSERQLLTSLLLSLDRDVTVVIIEHDMDVALTVAEQVTVMHDGSVVSEGTPAQIRSDTLVHDLYLGRAHAG